MTFSPGVRNTQGFSSKLLGSHASAGVAELRGTDLGAIGFQILHRYLRLGRMEGRDNPVWGSP